MRCLGRLKQWFKLIWSYAYCYLVKCLYLCAEAKSRGKQCAFMSLSAVKFKMYIFVVACESLHNINLYFYIDKSSANSHSVTFPISMPEISIQGPVVRKAFSLNGG